MHVHLRESDLDIVLAEQLVDLEQQLRGRLDADIVVPHPEAQGEVQGAGAEVGEQHHRRGVLEDVAVAVGHGGQQLHDQGGVAAVGHAHHHVTAHRTAVARPVDEARGHELGVGHVDDGVVVGLHDGGAHADLAHAARGGAHFDHVAYLHGAAEDEDQAGEEVVDDGLHAETDTDGQTTGDHGQVAQFHAQRAQGEQAEERPQGVGEGRLQGLDERGVDTQTAAGHARKEERAHAHGGAGQEEDADDEQHLHHVEARLAHVDALEYEVLQQGKAAGQGADPQGHAADDQQQDDRRGQGQHEAGDGRRAALVGQLVIVAVDGRHAGHADLQGQRAGDVEQVQAHAEDVQAHDGQHQGHPEDEGAARQDGGLELGAGLQVVAPGAPQTVQEHEHHPGDEGHHRRQGQVDQDVGKERQRDELPQGVVDGGLVRVLQAAQVPGQEDFADDDAQVAQGQEAAEHIPVGGQRRGQQGQAQADPGQAHTEHVAAHLAVGPGMAPAPVEHHAGAQEQHQTGDETQAGRMPVIGVDGGLHGQAQLDALPDILQAFGHGLPGLEAEIGHRPLQVIVPPQPWQHGGDVFLRLFQVGHHVLGGRQHGIIALDDVGQAFLGLGDLARVVADLGVGRQVLGFGQALGQMVDALQQGIDAVAGQQHGVDDLLHLLHGEGDAAVQGFQRVGPVFERVDEQEQAAGFFEDGSRLLGHGLRLLVDVTNQAASAAVDVVQHVLLVVPDVLQRVHRGGRVGFGRGAGGRFLLLGLVVFFGVGLFIVFLGRFIGQGTSRADEGAHLPAGVSGKGRHEAEDGQQHENRQGTEQAAIHGPPQGKAPAGKDRGIMTLKSQQ